MGEGALLVFIGTALIILGLPLLLAKKHPWLIFGWLVVGLSLVVLNPYTSIAPWGFIGGLRVLALYLKMPEALGPSYRFVIPVAIGRGMLSLVLLWLTWRTWRIRNTRMKEERR